MVGVVKIGVPGSGTNTPRTPRPPDARGQQPAPTSLGRAALATMIAALAPALVDNVIGEEFVRTR